MHDDPFQSVQGLHTTLTVILISVAVVVVGLMVMIIRSFRRSKPPDNITESDATRTLARDGIILDESVDSVERGTECDDAGVYVGGGAGFSSVEIL